MMNQNQFFVGQQVVMLASNPIESEGAAPGPGDTGKLVDAPKPTDRRRCWSVSFEDFSLIWLIPERHLTAVDQKQ